MDKQPSYYVAHLTAVRLAAHCGLCNSVVVEDCYWETLAGGTPSCQRMSTAILTWLRQKAITKWRSPCGDSKAIATSRSGVPPWERIRAATQGPRSKCQSIPAGRLLPNRYGVGPQYGSWIEQAVVKSRLHLPNPVRKFSMVQPGCNATSSLPVQSDLGRTPTKFAVSHREI